MSTGAEETARSWSMLVPARIRWQSVDGHRVLTLLAVAGLVIGGALAVFGLPPVDMHGPLHRFFGIMDPLCGGTRGVRYAMRGEWGLAWAYNPASIPLVLGAIALVVRHVVGMLSGRWLTLRIQWPRRIVLALIAAGVIALEINQQMHAALLS